jgi:hypothetical protein
MVIGVAGLLLVQHPRSIAIMRGAFGMKASAPPQIRVDDRNLAAWCAAHPQLPCK